jgi:hypothetical protein
MKAAKKVHRMKLMFKKEDNSGAVRNGERNLPLSNKFDLTWHDHCITPEFFKKLQPY